MQCYLVRNDAQFSVSPKAKEWGIKRLVHPLLQRERELTELLAMFEKQERGLGDTDELYGAYQSKVVFRTAYYLAQLDNVAGQVVIHDRLMLDTGRKGVDGAPPAYLRIYYSQGNACEIEHHGLCRNRPPILLRENRVIRGGLKGVEGFQRQCLR